MMNAVVVARAPEDDATTNWGCTPPPKELMETFAHGEVVPIPRLVPVKTKLVLEESVFALVVKRMVLVPPKPERPVPPLPTPSVPVR